MDLLIINSLKSVQPVMINDRYPGSTYDNIVQAYNTGSASADTALSAMVTIF